MEETSKSKDALENAILASLTKRLKEATDENNTECDKVLDDFVEALLDYISKDIEHSDKLAKIIVQDMYAGDNLKNLTQNIMDHMESDIFLRDRIKDIVVEEEQEDTESD